MADIAAERDMIQRPTTETTSVDARSAIVAAAFLTALGALALNIQPLVLGALADGYHLNDFQLGQVSATYIGFTTLGTLTAPLWIRRVDWRAVSLLATIASVAALGAGALANGAGPLLLVFAALGLALGGLNAPAFASLGDTASPDRAYGASILAQTLASAVTAVPLAALVIPRFGAPGMFLALAGVTGAGFIACRWLPRAGRTAGPDRHRAAGVPILSAAALPAALAILALIAFVTGISFFWFFMERIGRARGASAQLIGVTVSLCSVVTAPSAAIVAWLGARVPSLAFVTGGTVIILVGFAALALPGDAAFMTACLVFAFAWGLTQPGYWAVLRRVDATNRLFVTGPAAGGAGGVVAGMAGGAVIGSAGYPTLMLLSSAVLAVACLILMLAYWLSVRQGVRAKAIAPPV